jgi:hypothetical protein
MSVFRSVSGLFSTQRDRRRSQAPTAKEHSMLFSAKKLDWWLFFTASDGVTLLGRE